MSGRDSLIRSRPNLSSRNSPFPPIGMLSMLRTRILPLIAVLWFAMSCDATPTGPQTGSIVISLTTEAGILAQLRQFEPSASGEVPELRAGSDDDPAVLLDEVRVRVTGASGTRDVTSSSPSGGFFSLTVDNLAPGAYTVVVMGLVTGQVAHCGETSNVNVTAGVSTPASVTFPVFQPAVPNPTAVDTSDVLRFTVSYGAVPGATGYRIEWSQSATLTGASTKDTTATTFSIPVTTEGKWYYRVRSLNTNLTLPGLPSPTKGVWVFQGVATVSVTPPTPTVAAGATQQLAAEARDLGNLVVPSVNWFWSSNNHAVATVSQTGLVTAVAGGAVTIPAVGKGRLGALRCRSRRAQRPGWCSARSPGTPRPAVRSRRCA